MALARPVTTPLRLTFEEQKTIHKAFLLGFRPNRLQVKRKEIRLYVDQLLKPTDPTVWYNNTASEDLDLKTVKKCLKRLMPHLHHHTDENLLLDYNVFTRIKPEVRHLLHQYWNDDFRETIFMSDSCSWKSLQVADLWILTSLLFLEWPVELNFENEEPYFWRAYLNQALNVNVNDLDILEPNVWIVIKKILREKKYL